MEERALGGALAAAGGDVRWPLTPPSSVSLRRAWRTTRRTRQRGWFGAAAEKILKIKKAEGGGIQVPGWLAGVGIARQRQAIVDGLRDSVLAFSKKVPGTTANDIMGMVLVTQ